MLVSQCRLDTCAQKHYTTTDFKRNSVVNTIVRILEAFQLLKDFFLMNFEGSNTLAKFQLSTDKVFILKIHGTAAMFYCRNY